MSLTLGKAPFGPQTEGRFNFRREGPERTLYWEPFPKRVRAELGGETVADSRRVMALFETGRMLVFYFPRDDVAMDRLDPTERSTRCPLKGEARYWTVRGGGKEARNAAWAYDDPIESAAFLEGHIAFEHDAIDAWYEEADRVYAHPRDPYHRFDLHHAARRVVVRAKGVEIADSVRPQILFETGLPPRFYLPPEDVHTDLIERSATITHCPYKGKAQHWTLDMMGERIEDAAWTLPDPLGEAEAVRDWFSFYPGKVEIEVDGERLTA